MRIAIFGTGGVGGCFGAQLASAGEDVVFLARGEHLRAIQTKGLRLKTSEDEIVINPAKAYDNPSQVGEVDLIILGVKSWQVNDAAEAMKPMIKAGTIVLPLQNGVDAAIQLSEVLGAEHVIGGLCGTLSWVESPGCIRSIGKANFIRFSELDNRRTARTQALLKVFRQAGISSEIPSDIYAALWSKFLFVASFGGVGAITRSPIGIIRDIPETRRMLERCMQEIYAVARANDISLNDDIVERTMSATDRLPANATASLQRDITSNRPSELEAWSGAVVRIGKKVGIATPTHEFVYHSLLPMEMRARNQIEFPE